MDGGPVIVEGDPAGVGVAGNGACRGWGFITETQRAQRKHREDKGRERGDAMGREMRWLAEEAAGLTAGWPRWKACPQAGLPAPRRLGPPTSDAGSDGQEAG